MSVLSRYIRIFIMLILVVIIAIPVSTFAFVGENGAAYKGTYNYRNYAELNPESNKTFTEEELEENRKYIFQLMLQEGATPEGAAGILANIIGESMGNPTILEMGHGLNTWQDMVNAWDAGLSYGFGIFGFTHVDAITPVFDAAEKLGKSCLSMDAQTVGLIDILKNGTAFDNSSLWENKYNLDSEKYVIASAVCAQANYGRGNYYLALEGLLGKSTFDNVIKTGDLSLITSRISPGTVYYDTYYVRLIEARVKTALEYYEKFKDLGPLGSSESDKKGNSGGNTLSSVKEEWEVLGFKNPMKDTAAILNLVGSDSLAVSDSVKVAQIKDNMNISRYVSGWQIARICLVFIGLIMISYSVLLALATMADRVNILAQFGVVDIVSFGTMHYVGFDRESLDNIPNRRFKSTAGMIVVIASFFIFGMLLISGAILPNVMKAVYWVVNLFSFGKGA